MKTGIDDGVPMTRWAINLWRDPVIIADRKSGLSLRAVAKKHGVSYEKVRDLTKFEK